MLTVWVAAGYRRWAWGCGGVTADDQARSDHRQYDLHERSYDCAAGRLMMLSLRSTWFQDCKLTPAALAAANRLTKRNGDAIVAQTCRSDLLYGSARRRFARTRLGPWIAGR